MPELPEVETIRRGLDKKITGRKVTGVDVFIPKSFQGKPEKVIGQKVEAVERRAKLLRIKLEKTNLLIHLKMTGQLIYVFSKKRFAGGHPSHDWHAELPNKYTRVILNFDDGSRLFFNDLRRFGWIKVTDDKTTDEVMSEYGPEPLSGEFTVDYLIERAKRVPARNIKQFLMDQTIIAGVGNIYNDETLYLARISPLTKVGCLTKSDWVAIKASLIETLNKGIKYGGTTDSDYVDAEGKKGGMQEHLNVYHRQGLACHRGDGKIKRIKIGGRGTYYCPSCQKEIE
jgi:formamidopyrimidine-DNA glycosylase